MQMLIKIIVLLLLCQSYQSARILGIVPMPRYSNQASFRPLWKALAEQGHEVVVITTDPENDVTSKVHEINIHSTYEVKDRVMKLWTENVDSPIGLAGAIREIDLVLSEHVLALPDVAALHQNASHQHFDLVMAEIWWPTMFGFADLYKCNLIGLSNMELNNHMHELLGNTIHPIAFSDIFDRAVDITSWDEWWDRIQSFFYLPIYKMVYYYHQELIEKEDELWSKYFHTKRPSIDEMFDRIDRVFINILPPLMDARPVMQTTMYLGGMMRKHTPKPLPIDLQEFLDSGKNGVVYVSLGTNVKGDFITSKVRQAFLGAFRELPYKVLWKVDVKLDNVPANVKIVEWSPQQDVLRHPNIKAFVFQGGLQSLEEAIANKIPMIGIPFISDQDTNVRKLVKNGFGVGLNKDTITKESLKEAILEVASNPKYKKAVAQMAEIILDQPMTGLEKAVWWTEYVLRHKGAPHLRNPMMDLPFYQYYMLDMYLTILLAVIFIFILLILIIRSIFKCLGRLFKSEPKPVPKTKSKPKTN